MMKVIRMERGKVVKKTEFKDVYIENTLYSLTTNKFRRRLLSLLKKRGDFFEIGYEFKTEMNWVIINCGDNCIKWGP